MESKKKIFEGLLNEDAAELSLHIGDTYFGMPNKFWEVLLETISHYKKCTCSIGETYRKIDEALKLYKGMQEAFSIIKDKKKISEIWIRHGWRREYQEELLAMSREEQRQSFINNWGLKEEDFKKKGEKNEKRIEE